MYAARCNVESNQVWVDIFDLAQILPPLPEEKEGDDDDAEETTKVDAKSNDDNNEKSVESNDNKQSSDNADDNVVVEKETTATATTTNETSKPGATKDEKKAPTCDQGHELEHTTSAEGNYAFGWSCDM